MFKDPKFWCAIGAFVVATWLLVPQVWMASRPAVRPEDLRVTEYICRETKEVFRLSATGPVLANPKTGKATLVPALYDPRRNVWTPGPSADVRRSMKKRRG